MTMQETCERVTFLEACTLVRKWRDAANLASSCGMTDEQSWALWDLAGLKTEHFRFIEFLGGDCGIYEDYPLEADIWRIPKNVPVDDFARQIRKHARTARSHWTQCGFTWIADISDEEAHRKIN